MKRNIIIGCLISAAFIFLAVRGINFSDVIKSFRSANYLYTIPMIFLMVLVLYLRSYRWGIILAPRIKYPQWPLFVITAIGFMTISLLPARLGEFTRPLLVKQKSGIRISSTMATIVVERVFDLLALIVVLCLVIFTISLPSNIFKTGIIILAIVLVIFFALLLLAVRKEFSLKIISGLVDKLPARIAAAIKNQLHAFIEGLEILAGHKKNIVCSFSFPCYLGGTRIVMLFNVFLLWLQAVILQCAGIDFHYCNRGNASGRAGLCR